MIKQPHVSRTKFRVYKKHVNVLLVKISQALSQVKWLLGTKYLLWVIYHFKELDGPPHSQDEHEVRMEFHTVVNI